MAVPVLNRYEQSRIPNNSLPYEWRDQNSLDELAEFLQLNWEQRSVFYEDGQISSRQQYIGFTGQKGIRTNNYVGTVSFKGTQLNIFPKVFREYRDDTDTTELDLKHLMKNLVQWLQYCTRIDYPFISMASELDDSEDLRELFITLYLHYVKQALERGPYYRYEDRTEDLSVIKGHIDFKDYIGRKILNGQNHRFRCSFSEFEFDNLVNRIIKYTCKGLVNATASSDNKKIIRYIFIRLNEVSDVRCTPADCDSIRLSRMNSHYSVILSMSKMFLLNQTFSYQIDNQESFCFLFPTELLFEGFIGGFIGDFLQQEANVRLQASELTLINDMEFAGHSYGRAFTMKHDILVEHKTQGMFILDTKYKELDRFEDNPDLKAMLADKVSQGDLYQVLEYASHRGLSDVYLLYPLYRYEANEPDQVRMLRTSTTGESICVHIVRLPFVFEDDTEALKKQLNEVINGVFEQ